MIQLIKYMMNKVKSKRWISDEKENLKMEFIPCQDPFAEIMGNHEDDVLREKQHIEYYSVRLQIRSPLEKLDAHDEFKRNKL